MKIPSYANILLFILAVCIGYENKSFLWFIEMFCITQLVKIAGAAFAEYISS
jgi:hypothetical protein